MTKKEFDMFHLKKLGETLKYWRKKNKISLYELSQAMSINYHALKNIEEGNECATRWIDVKDRLPEKDEDVLVAMQDPDDTVHVEIRWRSIYDDVVLDENGFAIYPSEEKVLAWMPLPKYKMNTNNK